MNAFSPITLENIKDVEKYFAKSELGFCDFTPFVSLMWQELYKNEYAVFDGVLYLKFEIDSKVYYSTVTDDVFSCLDRLKTLAPNPRLSLVSEKGLESLKEKGVLFKAETDEGWWDYIYSGEDLRSFAGRRFAGQRNHINKLQSLYTDVSYESVTADNVKYVAEFYEKISLENGIATHDFEADMVKRYLESYSDFETLGGFVRAGGNIISFAFGEIISDMLFVHIEKADRNVSGSYPIIVREFARAHPTTFINREEDMGIEGLRTSKMSLHPIKLLKKYSITL